MRYSNKRKVANNASEDLIFLKGDANFLKKC